MAASAGALFPNHYQVFLSFRGHDAQDDFADSLYIQLKVAGVAFFFRDIEEIHGGEDISDTLIKAIERSDISIPIVSERFAESKACLVALAHMSLCGKTRGHKVIPILYCVEPSILEGFPEALENKLGKSPKLAEIFNNSEKIIEEWKKALSDLAKDKEKCLSLSKILNQRYRSELFSRVVSDVRAHLMREELMVADELLGIDHHVREMMIKLGVVYSDGRAVELCGEEIRVVTITGIPGVGKTTLAKVVFNGIQHLFHACSFLENIQESLHSLHRLESLQQQLISDLSKQEFPKSSYITYINALRNKFRRKRVLIILDDVRDIKEVEGLVSECNWFGPGSRIILTSSTDLQETGLVMKAQNHEVEVMDNDLAIQVFFKHACGKNLPQPFYEYDILAKQIVDVVTRIPSVIEAVGVFLHEEGIDQWKEKLGQLKRSPLEQFYKLFNVIYESLDDKLQQIFLDVACFFVGTDIKVSEYMWSSPEFAYTTGINRLHNMSWVSIRENNELWVPEQLQIFGKEKVKREHEDYWMCSRLWNHVEAKETLKKKKGTAKVEAICLTFDRNSNSRLTSEEFDGLVNLRYLRLNHGDISGDFKNLLSELRWLEWHGCPRTFKARNMHLEKLVVLDLSWSNITEDWQGWPEIQIEEEEGSGNRSTQEGSQNEKNEIKDKKEEWLGYQQIQKGIQNKKNEVKEEKRSGYQQIWKKLNEAKAWLTSKQLITLDNKSKSWSRSDPKEEVAAPNDGPTAHVAAQIFTFRELADATKNFRPECLLGSGTFGRVYRGRLKSTGQVVAVKRLETYSLQMNEEFLVEVRMLRILHHPNVVNLIGYCHDRDERLVVYEYMALGSLEDHLHGYPPDKKPLDWNTRMKIAAGVAKALEYLHNEAKPPVIYIDLKPSNILLDEGFHPKLSDFGDAKLCPVGDEAHFSTCFVGTLGYIAPEYIMTGHLTPKSVVYSFGVVLLELITGRKVLDNKRPPGEHYLVAWAWALLNKDRGDIPKMVDPLLQGQYPLRGFHQAVEVAAECLHEQPAKRPLIKDVVAVLEGEIVVEKL